MRRTQRAICGLTLAALMFSLLPALGARAARIRADIAPPQQAPGSSISPDKPTRVQMLAERVLIDVLSVKGKGREALPLAQVTASFTMRNAGTADETMTVRFPLTDPGGQGDGFGGFPEIENIAITVDGERVPFKVITTPNPEGADKPPVKWAAFDATFPAGKDVAIDVSYLLQSTGYMPYGTFRYILETGAGWDGPIGSGEIVLKLPYEATEENVVLDQSTKGATIEDGQVVWRYDDLEPTRQDNIEVTMLAPSVWQRILTARGETEANPGSAQAWRELAQAYLAAVYVRYGPQTGAKFVPLIEQAYKRAQALDPESAQYHAELAQILTDFAQPIVVAGLDPAAAGRILSELKAALERDPRNPVATNLAEELRDVLTDTANGTGAEADAARKQLESLEQIITATAADLRPLVTPTPSIMPTPEGDRAPAAETATEIVTATTDSGAIITATTVSTATQTGTDPATSRPVVVVVVQQTRQITTTADVTGTVPATVTEVTSTAITTSTIEDATAPAAGTVVTATTVVTETGPVDETGAAIIESTAIVTATTVTTATTEASPVDATKPATVTVIINATVVSPTLPSPESPAAGTVVTSTAVTTQTMPMGETGTTAPEDATTVTATTVTTATTEASPVDATKPATVTVIVNATVISGTEIIVGDMRPGTAVTSTAVTTQTMPMGETGTTAPEDATSASATSVTTTTVEPNPIDATQPATVTVTTAETESSSTVDATPVEPSVTATTTQVTETTIVTATTPMVDEATGVQPPTEVFTSIQVVTATVPLIIPGATPGATQVVTATRVQTATVDAAGVITPGTPVIIVATGEQPTVVTPPQTPPLTPTLPLAEAQASLQAARAVAEAEAQNADAWRALATALLARLAAEPDKQSVEASAIATELADAYAKATELKPEDDALRLEAARGLLQAFVVGVTAPTQVALAEQMLSQLKAVLATQPTNPAALALLAELKAALAGSAAATGDTSAQAQDLLGQIDALEAAAVSGEPRAQATPAAAATAPAETAPAEAAPVPTEPASGAATEATPLPAATAPSMAEQAESLVTNPMTWLAMLATYIIGALIVYALHRRQIAKDERQRG